MKNNLKILLVEDEAIAAMLMKMELRNAGYEVAHHVVTGEEAIISARQNPPDIILMDIRLAGEIDGIDAASTIKSGSNIPIIFITSYNSQTIKERAEKIGHTGYFIKPVDVNKLKTIFENL